MTRWESNMVQVARGYLLAKDTDAALDVLEAILKSEKQVHQNETTESDSTTYEKIHQHNPNRHDWGDLRAFGCC